MLARREGGQQWGWKGQPLYRFGIGVSGALLVRPDGFVAWRAESDAEASAEEMRRVLGAVLAK